MDSALTYEFLFTYFSQFFNNTVASTTAIFLLFLNQKITLFVSKLFICQRSNFLTRINRSISPLTRWMNCKIRKLCISCSYFLMKKSLQTGWTKTTTMLDTLFQLLILTNSWEDVALTTNNLYVIVVAIRLELWKTETTILIKDAMWKKQGSSSWTTKVIFSIIMRVPQEIHSLNTVILKQIWRNLVLMMIGTNNIFHKQLRHTEFQNMNTYISCLTFHFISNHKEPKLVSIN